MRLLQPTSEGLFSNLVNNLFSIFYLEEDPTSGVITIGGVKRGGEMIGQLGKVFNTTRVGIHLFISIDDTRFSFHKFYAIDVLYVLRKLLTYSKLTIPVKTINAVIEKIETETWVKDSLRTYPSKLDYHALKEFNVSPMEHQSNFFEHYDQVTQRNHLTGLMLGAAAGTGKTLISLMLTRMLRANQVIIVCPLPTVETVWVDNITRFFHTPPTVWWPKSPTPFTGKEEYIIINYEYLQKLLDITPQLSKGKVSVILDESHNLNESKTNRSSLFVELCLKMRSADTLWLSGTPVKAVALETIPLIRSIDPMFTPTIEKSFRGLFKGTNTALNVMLGSRLEIYMKRIQKEVLSLEPPIEETINITMPNGIYFTLPAIQQRMASFIDERKKYYATRAEQDHTGYNQYLSNHRMTLSSKKDIKEFDDYVAIVQMLHNMSGPYWEYADQMAYATQYERTKILPQLRGDHVKIFKELKTIYKYIDLKINGECLGKIVGGARSECHVEMCKHIPISMIVDSSEKKTVIFTSFIEVVTTLDKQIRELGLNPIVAYGKVSKDLPTIVKAFSTDANINPLITTFATLSTGVPLIAADRMLLVNSPFRPHVLNQSIARIWRLGTTTQVKIFKTLLDTGDVPNISTRAGDILQWAAQSVKEITGIAYVSEDSTGNVINDMEATFGTENIEAITGDTLAYCRDDGILIAPDLSRLTESWS